MVPAFHLVCISVVARGSDMLLQAGSITPAELDTRKAKALA
ncbi:hypothetical protein ACTHAM_000719 [Cellulomonas soli]